MMHGAASRLARPLAAARRGCASAARQRAAAVLADYKGASYPEAVEIELRWRDMDAMAHVNNAAFFTFFEQARTAVWARAGLALDGRGERPILRRTAAEFKAPLRFPDTLAVGVRAVQINAREYEHHYAVVSHASGRVVATGHGVFVNYDYDAGRPADLSARMQRVLFGAAR
jgi:acyl-CoA thioester hydrolase